MEIIKTENLSISYGELDIIKNLNLKIPKGEITTIIGPNGCGKSTLLKTIARIIKPKEGTIYLDGKEIHKEQSKSIAKLMAVLPQSPQAPKGLTVSELVAYGRFPRQKAMAKLSKEDRDIIDWSLKVTKMSDFKDRPLEALSGGQRQRVWISMALAQETEVLILDEPTTYLDLAHQLEILKLLKELNIKQHRTIVMVIHELNNAARFADYMIAMRSGKVIKEGTAQDIMTKETLKDVFNINAHIVQDEINNRPVCLSYDLL